MSNQNKQPFYRWFIRGVGSPEVRNLFIMLIILLVIGTVFYRLAEDWRWIDSLYFSVLTITTIGSTEFNPTTDASKLFTVFYVFAGLGVALTFLQTLARKQARKPFLKRLFQNFNNDDDS